MPEYQNQPIFKRASVSNHAYRRNSKGSTSPDQITNGLWNGIRMVVKTDLVGSMLPEGDESWMGVPKILDYTGLCLNIRTHTINQSILLCR